MRRATLMGLGIGLGLVVIAAMSWGLGIAGGLWYYARSTAPNHPQTASTHEVRPSFPPPTRYQRPAETAAEHPTDTTVDGSEPPESLEQWRTSERSRMQEDVLKRAEEAFEDDVFELVQIAMDERHESYD